MAVTGWGPDFDDPFTYMGYWNSGSKDMGVTFDNAEFDALLIAPTPRPIRPSAPRSSVEAEALFADIGPAIPLRPLQGRGRGATLGEGRAVLGLRRQRQLRLRRHRGIVQKTGDAAVRRPPRRFRRSQRSQCRRCFAYILHRLLIALVAIFVLATITFFLMRLVPGDPFAGPASPPRSRSGCARTTASISR